MIKSLQESLIGLALLAPPRIVEVAPDGAAGSPTRGRGAEDKTVELWDISGSPE
jgi:hypothetical protein